MKKVVAIALALAALVASYAVADDDAVYSVNTIGVIKYTVPPEGGLTCVSLPLEPMNDGVETKWGNTTLADQLLPGSKVFFWGGTSWQGYTKSSSGKWLAVASNRVVQAGEAVFLQSPTTQTTDHVIALVGELPTDEEMTYTINGEGNLVARGVTSYPVEGKFGDSELAALLPNSSKVYFWNGSSWQSYTKSTSGKWLAVASNKVYSVGQGIFIQDAGASTIITNKIPYDL